VVKVKIGYLSTIYHTSLIIKNLNKEICGEKIDWQLYATGPAMIDGFDSGEIDLGYIGLPPVMIGINKGIDLKCIAGGHVEGTVMVASAKYESYTSKKDINEIISQFVGKTIGVPSRGCIHDVIIKEIVGNLDIKIKNYGWADLIPYALEDGEIDAGVGTPAMAVAASSIASSKVIIPPEQLWHYNPSYGVSIRKEIFGEKREFVKEFLMVHENICNMIREFPTKTSKIASGELGLENNLFALNAFKISPKYCSSLPEEYINSTLKFIPILKDLGYLDSNLESKDIFDTELIEKIHTKKPHYENPWNLI
jgi:NitT/TauT family transport system substrate-binding protein